MKQNLLNNFFFLKYASFNNRITTLSLSERYFACSFSASMYKINYCGFRHGKSGTVSQIIIWQAILRLNGSF